jgi:hypothetical protein
LTTAARWVLLFKTDKQTDACVFDPLAGIALGHQRSLIIIIFIIIIEPRAREAWGGEKTAIHSGWRGVTVPYPSTETFKLLTEVFFTAAPLLYLSFIHPDALRLFSVMLFLHPKLKKKKQSKQTNNTVRWGDRGDRDDRARTCFIAHPPQRV